MPDRKPRGLEVVEVAAGSPAQRSGLAPGDVVVSVNSVALTDELAFRFTTSGALTSLGIVRGDAESRVRLDCRSGEPPGVTFGDLLADGIRTCDNRCVFCFIHQMPRRMRRSLYVMDDDYRLSFVHGNYVTLTNLSDVEFERIVQQGLSPMYVSVHATDPVVRGGLLGRMGEAPVLPRLQWLAERRISVHAQVVLCPGINDGPCLDRTVADLAELHPAAGRDSRRSGVLSVAVVPVGLTRYRDRLPSLRVPDGSCARRMVSWLRRQQSEMMRAVGTRFVWLSDEWYYLAGAKAPGRRHYEGFPQLDDGVGTTRLFLDDLRATVRRLPSKASVRTHGTVVTGELARDPVVTMCSALNRVEGIEIAPLVVRNDWFGGTITTAGLLTAHDIAGALGMDAGAGDVFVPEISLKEGAVFLDDRTVSDLEASVGRRVRVVPASPSGLADALGLTRRRVVG
jgi:putative radical SAM enzyme (TIGR03279 family)